MEATSAAAAAVVVVATAAAAVATTGGKTQITPKSHVIATEELHNRGSPLQKRAYSEAVTAFEAALMIRPQHFTAQHNLGLALRSTGRIAESIGVFRNILHLPTAAI